MHSRDSFARACREIAAAAIAVINGGEMAFIRSCLSREIAAVAIAVMNGGEHGMLMWGRVALPMEPQELGEDGDGTLPIR